MSYLINCHWFIKAYNHGNVLYMAEQHSYKSNQGDLDDAQENTAVWTYFRNYQVEQLFQETILKGR